MTDISTTYLGLNINSPVIISSSALTGDLQKIVECERFGAGAVVLKSIFEEQIRAEAEHGVSNSNEMYHWFPEAKEHVMGLTLDANLDKYLKFVKEAKKAVSIPVIASINCKTSNEWSRFAKSIEQAGADAIELNISIFPFNASLTSAEIEGQYIEILKAVKKEVSIPVSVKLGSYFTNLCSIARDLVNYGAQGLVLFNRFYRPDIDINTMEVIADNFLSIPEEQSISLRWIALMAGSKINCDLVAATGVHYHIGVIKMLLGGAQAVQICSTLYANGIPYIETILSDLKDWMTKNRFEKLDDFRGKALNESTTLPSFERIQFIKRDFE